MQIKTIATAGVVAEMRSSGAFDWFVRSSMHRHLAGDWGEVSENDRETNNAAPLYALSAYTAPDGRKIWIKQDGGVLTVLFPDEY